MLRKELVNWEFRLAEPDVGFEQVFKRPFPWLPAKCPSHVHVDLYRNGMLEHPFRGQSHLAMEWIESAAWLYRCEFRASPRDFVHSSIRFDCLDGIALVSLNGTVVGIHENAFLPLEISTDGLLKESNLLEVLFKPLGPEVIARREAYLEASGLPLDQPCFDERVFVRKPAYSWGWDWAPRLPSCGIAGPVELTQFDDRIEAFDLSVHPLGNRKFRVEARLASTSGTEIVPVLQLAAGANAVVIGDGQWEIEGGEWYPRELGPQAIHSVAADHADHQIVRTFGLRTVKINRDRDPSGERFEFSVNGHPIWAKGANWIPPNFFLSGPLDGAARDIEQAISEFADLGFNMLRVWGGGLYESESYYNACDRAGIMVWQDFPFACMYSPDDEHWQNMLRAEAGYHIRRLRTHPSLTLWCGNNECQTMHESWLGSRAAPRLVGENLWNSLLPDLVAQFDPGTPYIPTSPTGSDPAAEPNCNNPNFGTCHYWEVWHGKGDWVHYRDVEPRFCAEFGFASPCSMATWVKTISKEDIESFPGLEFLSHDKTGKDFEAIRSLVELHYPRANTLEEWVYFAQLNQRDAIRCAIEHLRSCPACNGALLWQANDCWPGSTWAVCDSFGVMKPAGFELARLFAEAVIAASFEGGKLVTGIVGKHDAEIRVQRFDTLTGEELNSMEFPERALISSAFRVSAEGLQPRWCYAVEPKDLALRCQPLEVSRGEVWEIRVGGFVADLVAYCAHSHEPLRLVGQSHEGSWPVTAAGEVLKYLPPSSDEPVVFCSLAGIHDILDAGV